MFVWGIEIYIRINYTRCGFDLQMTAQIKETQRALQNMNYIT